MRNLFTLLAIPFAMFNIALVIGSIPVAVFSVLLFATLLIPYVGSILKDFADSHYEYRRVDCVSGFTVHRIGK